MTPVENLALIHKVVDLLWGEGLDEIMFRPEPDGTVHLYAMCNDVFGWACSDSEEITSENVSVFEQAWKDVDSVDPFEIYKKNRDPANKEHDPNFVGALNMGNHQKASDAAILFACRVRKQKPFEYKKKDGGIYPVHLSVHPLIEAITDQKTDMDKPWKDLGLVK